MPPRLLLLAGGIACFALAVFHLVVIAIGAGAYRYFGAREVFAQQSATGSLWPALLTFAVALMFAVFGFYGVAGAGVAPRPPLLRAALVLITMVFVLRGLVLLPQLWYLVCRPGVVPARYAVFSGIALVIGLLFVAGLAGSWSALIRQESGRADAASHAVGREP